MSKRPQYSPVVLKQTVGAGESVSHEGVAPLTYASYVMYYDAAQDMVVSSAATLDDILSRLTALENQVVSLEGQTASLESQVASLEARLDVVELGSEDAEQ